MWTDILKTKLTLHEGRKNKIYTDTVGNVTCGIGHNLSDKGVSDAVIDLLYQEDVADAIADVKKLIPAFDSLSDNRKIALTDFSFQLGYFKMSQFTNSIALLNSGKFSDAADNMLQSLWAKQVPSRAKEVTDMIRNG
jgi:GH24 family phage-related lysozyme (muramidase)